MLSKRSFVWGHNFALPAFFKQIKWKIPVENLVLTHMVPMFPLGFILLPVYKQPQ